MFKLENNRVVYTGRRPRSLKQAFKVTLGKWEFIIKTLKEGKAVYGTGGTATCGLCLLSHNNCNACPIAKKTGYWSCLGTPYDEIEGLQDKILLLIVRMQARMRQLQKKAEAELAFLQQLANL
jgi:hypothetical protein